MRQISELDLDGITVQVREATVAEARAWLSGMDTPAAELLDAGLELDGVSLYDLRAFCDLDDERVAGATPAQLRKVAQEVKRLNADFFRVKAWRADLLARHSAAGPATCSATSTEPPSD